MTQPTESERRPSHDLLMEAQEALGKARDAEHNAGNLGASMVLNDLVISLFQIAVDTEFDQLANAAYEQRYGGAS